MNLLADSNWLILLEREFRRDQAGPARELLGQQIFVNPITHCEFFSKGHTPLRDNLWGRMRKLPHGIDYGDADQAANLRMQCAKRGKALNTPDALLAATAMRHRLRLVTADKDFSGIPGLDWSSYPRSTDA
jgi:predicted nucleic acid-binding protein